MSKKSEQRADSTSAGSVTLTIQDTLQAQQALAQLTRERRPILGAVKMRTLARMLVGQLEDYEAERQKLLGHYGKKDEDGKPVVENGQVVLTDEGREAFAKDFAALLKVTWTCPMTLRVADFGGLDVAPDLLIGLGDLLDTSESEKTPAKPTAG